MLRAALAAERELAARWHISLAPEISVHEQPRAGPERPALKAARWHISLAPAISVHAQPSTGPERPTLQAAFAAARAEWAARFPLYLRLSALPPAAPSGSVAAELDGWLRSRRRLSEEQLLAYVRKLRKFRHHKRAVEMLLILTKSVNRCFEKNPKFDIAPLLGGTDAVFLSLLHGIQLESCYVSSCIHIPSPCPINKAGSRRRFAGHC